MRKPAGKVVELSATRPIPQSSPQWTAIPTGIALACEDGPKFPSPIGRRRKLPPGMTRRSSRNWARPAQAAAGTQCAPQEYEQLQAAENTVAPAALEPEPEPKPELEPEPEPEPEPDFTQLESSGEEEDPERDVAAALIVAASEGNAAEVARLLKAADINTALQPSEEVEESWRGTTALIAAAVREQS